MHFFCTIFHCKINDLVHENMADIDSLDEDIKMSVVKFKEEKQKKIKGISKAIYIIARIGNQEVNTKYIEILNNHSKYLVNGYELQQDTKVKMYGNENNYWRNKK